LFFHSLNRRLFIKSSAIGMVAMCAGGVPRFLERLLAGAAHAAPIQHRRKTLVAIFQRGAMDGLMAVSPFGDDGLRRLRPRLAMSMFDPDEEARLLDLGGGFGLHPAFGAFEALYNEGSLAVVHGAGSPNNTRSHFDAQDYMETGTPFRKGTDSGWLNRALAQNGSREAGDSPFRAVSLTSSLPRSLYGSVPALAVADLTRFGLGKPVKGRLQSPPAKGFESLYGRTSQELLNEVGGDSFAAMHTLAEMDVSMYRPSAGAEYPTSPLGKALTQIAYLIKARVGLEVAFAETGGWDTHVQQGAAQGAFANRARDLANSIAAFWTDLGAHRDDVVLLTMTEFGRTVHQNGSGGTDHGRASCLFVLGVGVDGGKVYGSIPQLRRDDLEDGRDLPVVVDFRSVFAEVAGHWFDIGGDDNLFPGWDGNRIKLF
jgi:uncharacterized protein (DUF1501 family)